MTRSSQLLRVVLAVMTLTAADVRAEPAGHSQAPPFGTTSGDHLSSHSGAYTPWGGPGSATDIVCRDGGFGAIEDLKAPGRGRLFECLPDADKATSFAR